MGNHNRKIYFKTQYLILILFDCEASHYSIHFLNKAAALVQLRKYPFFFILQTSTFSITKCQPTSGDVRFMTVYTEISLYSCMPKKHTEVCRKDVW